MDIGIFGATGVIGDETVREAVRRGHRVTAFARDAARFPAERETVDWQVADWLDTDSIAAAIGGLDVVISAVNAGYGVPDTIANAQNFVIGARAMIGALERHPSVRLISIGGAGSLEVAPGLQIIESPDFERSLIEDLQVPLAYEAVVRALREALNLYRQSNRNWTSVSPSALRIPAGGERTGRFRIGTDQILVRPDGTSDISAPDLAIALLDEVEQPRFIQRRFTVGY
ncbi:NAD-dependent epimerase/dehydratase family protein [Nocardia panacis]|uniref:NAD-dependent epimerase/dehydratase family protein n=1 Tax=Nocardia panacis TaxID=2340916 RepID=A0A3A4JKX3_9NOCA|nr:NAD(P)H-binding protein [Nocardia panacis]RJO69245.1 NAD-dependent epimerase/dehydratase family protein [Nocardia panacis]